jgi:hypothetical protein
LHRFRGRQEGSHEKTLKVSRGSFKRDWIAFIKKGKPFGFSGFSISGDSSELDVDYSSVLDSTNLGQKELLKKSKDP